MTARLYLILAFACWTPSLAIAQESPKKLPLGSAVLVEKFDRYSADLRREAEEKIATKREEVIKVLKKHLEERTKSGDLDGAVAIRDLLKEWERDSEAAKKAAKSTTGDKKSGIAWKSLIQEGAEPLGDWTYQEKAPIQVEDGIVTITSKDKSYTPLYRPTAKDNVVIGLSVKVEHDRSVEKQQQAGIGFQLVSKEEGKDLGNISCVIQGPDTNLVYGEIGGEEGKVLGMEKNSAGVDRLSEMQIALVGGHFLVFSKKRKIHDFYDPRLKDAVATTVILFGNNSEVEFQNIRSLVPDPAQAEKLLSGKPVE